MTLDRAIRFGKTPGCCGCDRIAEGAPHTYACHDRFGTLSENEELVGAPENPAPKTPAPAPSTAGVPLKLQTNHDVRRGFLRCHKAPENPNVRRNELDGPEKLADFWE